MLKRTISIAAVCALMLAMAMAPAVAEENKANTRLKLKLDDSNVPSGSNVTGQVKLLTGAGENRAPLSGATLTLKLDGDPVGTLVTNSEGIATFTLTSPSKGGHVVKVIYAGDATHQKAKAARGFRVAAPAS